MNQGKVMNKDGVIVTKKKKVETVDTLALRGHVRIMRADTKEVLYEDKNIIVNVVKFLFARLMANTPPGTGSTNGGPIPLGQATAPLGDPLYGVWGLAIGSGDPSWSPDTQPAPTATQTALITQILRKQLSSVNFVDTNFNPVNYFTTQVDFQTIVNATTDNINQIGIREMGLIGGGVIGSPDTNMLTAPYWNPALIPPGPANSVILVNYFTLPPLILPPEVNIIFSWVLSF
jgi:hypothetical protein